MMKVLEKESEWVANLLDGTPTNTELLLVVWEDLTFNQRVGLLLKLSSEEFAGRRHSYLKVLQSAFASASPYLRFVSARMILEILKPRFYSDGAAEGYAEFLSRLKSDASSVVRSVAYEKWGISGVPLPHRDGGIIDGLYYDPDEFFGLPQSDRLGALRTLYHGSEAVAHLFEAAVSTFIPNGAISQNELIELVAEYFSPRKSELWNALLHHHGEREALPHLWKVSVRLPDEASQILIERLPLEEFLLSTRSSLKKCSITLSEVVLDKKFIEDTEYDAVRLYFEAFSEFDDQHLIWLLRRNDIALPELRLSILESIASGSRNDFPDYLADVAASHHLPISDDYLRELMSSKTDRSTKILRHIGWCANGLSLHQYAAIEHHVKSEKVFDGGRCVHGLMISRIMDLSESNPEQLETELVWWQTFDLAMRVVESGAPNTVFPNVMRLVEGVANDVWAIFLRLCELHWIRRSRPELQPIDSLLFDIGLTSLPDRYQSWKRECEEATQPSLAHINREINQKTQVIAESLKRLEHTVDDLQSRHEIDKHQGITLNIGAVATAAASILFIMAWLCLTN